MKTSVIVLLFITAAAASAFSVYGKDQPPARVIRLHGGVAMAEPLARHKAEIEKECGVRLEILGNTAPAGLVDLLNRKADIALATGGLENVARGANSRFPGSVPNLKGLVRFPAGETNLDVVVNEENPIRQLTLVQLRDIFSGKITSWKELGWIDIPIAVATSAAGAGNRNVIDRKVLDGLPLVKTAREFVRPQYLSPFVAKERGGISGVPHTTVYTGVVIVTVTPPVRMEMELVTLGKPDPVLEKVVGICIRYLAAEKNR